MATAKSNKKVQKTTKAGKAKSKPDKAAKAATAKSGAAKTTATKSGTARGDGKKAGIKKTEARKGSTKMTDGKKTAAIKSAAIKTTAAKTTAGKTTAAKTTAGKTSGVKSSGVKTAAKKPPPKKPSTKKTAKAEGKTSNRAYRLEHMDDRILAKIIAKLEEMREESQHIVNTHVQSDLMPREESLDVGDDLDQASNERDREFNLIMHQRHLRRLHQIEEAFNRMDDGSYGLCEGTDETINPKRLLIMPLTKYSIEYQELQEKTLGRISLEGSFLETDESFGSDE